MAITPRLVAKIEAEPSAQRVAVLIDANNAGGGDRGATRRNRLAKRGDGEADLRRLHLTRQCP